MNPKNSKNLPQLSYSLIHGIAFAFRAFTESCSSHPSAFTSVKNVLSLLPLALFILNFHSPLKDHLKIPISRKHFLNTQKIRTSSYIVSQIPLVQIPRTISIATEQFLVQLLIKCVPSLLTHKFHELRDIICFIQYGYLASRIVTDLQ